MIKLIWAMTESYLIGNGNDLPWNYPEDLKYFKKNTLNKDVLMGLNTYNSIVSRIGKPLPKRNNFVLSFNKIELNGATCVTNLNSFLDEYKNNDKELFVIGGKTVYDQTINHADYLYITFIRKEYIGDVYFSKFDLDAFEEIERTDLEEISFVIYKRK